MQCHVTHAHQHAAAGGCAGRLRQQAAMQADGLGTVFDGVNGIDSRDTPQWVVGVITSYSIHYTKLYDGCQNKCCSQQLANPTVPGPRDHQPG